MPHPALPGSIRRTLTATAILLAGLPAAAQAATSYSLAGSALTIGLSGAGSVVLSCAGGNVADGGTPVNGGSGPVACGSVLTLTVDGSAAADTIDLSGVSSSAGFAGLLQVVVDGHDGVDTITGSAYDDRLTGGKGSDTLTGGAGTDTVHEDLNVQGGTWLHAATDPLDLTHSTVEVPGSPDPSNPERDQLHNVERLLVTTTSGDDAINGASCSCGGGPFRGDIIVDGGAGNDNITGGDGNDTLKGGAGTDALSGGGGNDTVDGGGDPSDHYRETLRQAGTLTLTNGGQTPGRATLTGSMGTDDLVGFDGIILQGSSGDDVLDATGYDGPGADLQGYGGDDQLYGGPAGDSLSGGTGNDTMIGGAGDDHLREAGGGGDDTMEGGPGNDELIADVGDDTLIGGPGDDWLDGGAGNDRAYATGSQLALTGASGQPKYLTGDAGQDRIWSGTIDTFVLTGTPGADTIDGGTFTKTVQINGLGGDDHLTPGLATSTIDGGAGTDSLDLVDAHPTLSNTALTTATHGPATLLSIEAASLTGTAAGDTLDATAFTGRATLTGLAGDDTLVGGEGNDSLSGGAGNNALDGGSAGTDTVVETGGSQTLTDASWTDGTAVDSLARIERASLGGSPGDDTIDASAFSGDAAIVGGAGNDTLVGGSGSDVLTGGSGSDAFDGGDGADKLFARDGEIDASVSCGAGAPDRAEVDPTDPISDTCEQRDDGTSPAPAPAPAPSGGGEPQPQPQPQPGTPGQKTPPTVSIDLNGTGRGTGDGQDELRKSIRRQTGVIRLVVACPKQLTNGCRGPFYLKTYEPQLVRGTGGRRKLTLGVGRFAAAAGERTAIKIELGPRHRALLERKGQLKVHLLLVLVDKQGRRLPVRKDFYLHVSGPPSRAS